MNITLPRAVIEQALEALENVQGLCTDANDGWVEAVTIWTPEAITALRAALGQQYMTNAAGEIEPVTVVQTGVGIWKLEQVKLRRGDILRCIETDELCTVWATSTTGKTLVKWGANNFGEYTAEQIGELFWLESEPHDLELAAEQSGNYAAFHAGYRFAVAHSSTQPEQEPVAWMLKTGHGTEFKEKLTDELRALTWKGKPMWVPLYTSPPQRKPLSDEQRDAIARQAAENDWHDYEIIDAVEAAHGIKEKE